MCRPRLADDDGELALVVELDRGLRPEHRRAGGGQRGGHTQEERGVGGDRVPAFLGVQRVVEADADELGRPRDGQRRLHGGKRQLGGGRRLGRGDLDGARAPMGPAAIRVARSFGKRGIGGGEIDHAARRRPGRARCRRPSRTSSASSGASPSRQPRSAAVPSMLTRFVAGQAQQDGGCLSSGRTPAGSQAKRAGLRQAAIDALFADHLAMRPGTCDTGTALLR